MAMELDGLVERSHELSVELIKAISYPLYDDSQRIEVCDLLCSLAMEHAHSVRALLYGELLLSALVIHRSQFEAVVRAAWVLYCANDGQIAKLAAELNVDSEQAAKSLPNVSAMMEGLSPKAPPELFEALREFMAYNWKALNSYTHAGIHPLRRHEKGYPPKLMHDVLLNVNGMMICTVMLAAVLTGVPTLQKRVLALADRYPDVLAKKAMA